MRGFDAVRALLSALILVVLAWAGCALAHWAEEEARDFPGDLICVLVIAAAIIGWIVVNFGNPLRR